MIGKQAWWLYGPLVTLGGDRWTYWRLQGDSSAVTKGSVTTFGGRPVVTLRASDGNTAYVVAVGPPHLIGIKVPPGQGSVTADQFGTATAPRIPADAVNIGG